MDWSKTNRRARSLPAVVAVLLVAAAIAPAELGADSFRCGRKVVRTGDSSSDLLQKCGEPRSRDRSYEPVRLEGGRKKVRVERWHYQRSVRSLSRAVLIYQGHIVGIETGER